MQTMKLVGQQRRPTPTVRTLREIYQFRLSQSSSQIPSSPRIHICTFLYNALVISRNVTHLIDCKDIFERILFILIKVDERKILVEQGRSYGKTRHQSID